MNRVDIEHPAIKEMISRRSDGDPMYVAGIRAFLSGGSTPPEGSIAYKGYRDAHDMTGYLLGIYADMRADEFAEENKLLRVIERQNVHWALQDQTEDPKHAQEVRTKQSRGLRL